MPARISLVVLDGVLESALGVTADVLAAANRIVAGKNGMRPFEVRVVGASSRVRASTGRRVATDATFSRAPLCDVVVVAGINTPLRTELEAALTRADVRAAQAFVADRARRGALVCAACSGTFVVAEAGLLDGYAATTSWWLAPVFRQRYPRVELRDDAVIVQAHSRVVTAGAALSQIDLMLWLVRRTCGPEVARVCARYLVVDERRSQARYALVNHIAHDSEAVLLAERYVRRNLDRGVSVGELARAARVSARTLARRMHEALGLAPLQFVQRLKVEQAAHLLGTTRLAFDEIARRVGYEDPGALRRLLRRELGATARSLRA
jgi:transcriptional regulator GlxA family with amidase domain